MKNPIRLLVAIIAAAYAGNAGAQYDPCSGTGISTSATTAGPLPPNAGKSGNGGNSGSTSGTVNDGNPGNTNQGNGTDNGGGNNGNGGGSGPVDQSYKTFGVTTQLPGVCGPGLPPYRQGPPVVSEPASPAGAIGSSVTSEASAIMSVDPNLSSVTKRIDFPGPLSPTSDDPVRDGELVYQHVDLELPSAGVPFRFERTYRSRVSHWGVLGYGWDFTYNRRLIAANRCGDIDLLTGDSGRVRFARSSAGQQIDAKTVAYDYSAPQGVPLILRGLFTTNGDPAGKRWILTDKTRTTYEFDYRGTLLRIVDAAGNYLEFTWTEASQWKWLQVHRDVWSAVNRELRPVDRQLASLPNADIQWHIKQVTDSAHPERIIYFNYSDSDFFLKCIGYQEDCRSPLVSFDVHDSYWHDFGNSYANVTYWTYSVGLDEDFGDLLSVVDADGVGQRYRYYHDYSQSSAWLTDEDAATFCASACGDASDCSASALCTIPAQTCLDSLATYSSDHPNVDYGALCVDSILNQYHCTIPYPGTPSPWVVDPFCLSEPSITDAACENDCVNNSRVYISQECGNARPSKFVVPGVCTAAMLPAYCRTHCYAQNACRTAAAPSAACEAIARSVQPSYCGSSCYQDCRARYEAKDPNGNQEYAYGRIDELNHNLVDVFQFVPASSEVPDPSRSTWPLVQHNEYGRDPQFPSFDKVVTQQLGKDLIDPTSDNAIVFSYFDLKRWKLPQVVPLTTIPGLLTGAARLPRAMEAAASATVDTVLGTSDSRAFTGRVGRIIDDLEQPLDGYVQPVETFGSLNICPAKCIAQKPAPLVTHLPPFPRVISLPPSTSSVDQRVVVRRTGDAAVNIAAPGRPPAFRPLLRAITPHGTVTLSALDASGGYAVNGASDAVTAFVGTGPSRTMVIDRGTLASAPSPERLGSSPPGPVPPPGGNDSNCGRWTYVPWVQAKGATDPQLPVNAVVVQDLHGVVRTDYYDEHGRILRDVNHHVVDHGPKEVTDYNYDSKTGAVHGVSYPNGQRLCQEFDKNGSPAQLTRIPAANSVVDAAPQVTLFNYVADDVIDVVVDPDSQTPARTHYERDNAGRVLSITMQVDATNTEKTTYEYDPLPALLPKSITHPNGSITVLTEPTTITPPILKSGFLNHPSPKPLTLPTSLATGPLWITEDPLGSEPITTKIEYDSNGHRTHSFRWGHRFGTSAQTGVTGRLLQTGYDAPDGTSVPTTYSYKSRSSLPTDIKEPTSTTTYGRDSLDHLRWTAQVGTDGSKRATCWNYSANGRLDAVLLPEGNLIENTYDDANRLRTVKQGYPSSLPAWASTCVAELSANRLPTPVMPKEPADEQLVKTLDYDDAGFLKTIDDGSGTASIHDIVDGFGRVIEEFDDDGNHLRRGYDSRGRVAWEAVYGPNPPAYAKPTAPDGQLQSMVEYQYDNKDRVVRTDRWHFAGAQWINPTKPIVTTIATYDDAHSRVSVSIDGHPATVTEFDGLGRARHETLPNQNTVTTTFKDNGTAGELVTWTATGPDGQPRSGINYFDDYGHLLRSDDDLGVTTLSNGYNVFGQLVSRTVASQVSGFGYDSFHRLTSISEGSGKNARSLTYVSDGNDRLIEVIDAVDNTTTYSYNGLDLVSHAQHPANGTSFRHYVPGSRRLNDETDQWGTTRSFGYYGSGRVRWEHTSNPALLYGSGIDRHFAYSPLGQITSAVIDGNGQNPTNGVTTTLAYDSLGNRILDSISTAPFSVSDTWDPVGGPLRTTFSFVRSPTVTRTFDDVGRLKDVRVNGDPVATFKRETDLGKIVYGLGKVVAQPTFDHRGRKVGVDVSLNGTPMAFIHDALNVDSVVRERQRLRGGQVVTDFYQLDDAGRVVGENLAMGAIPSLSLPSADLADKDIAPYLSDPTKSGNTYRLYGVDGVANWLSRTEAIGTATTQFTSPVGLNQYQVGPEGQNWQYIAGTVSQIGSDVYRADVFGHLATATVGGQSVQYGYDALGRRITEQSLTTGAQTTIVWDGNQPIAFGSGGAFSTYSLRVGGDGLDEQVALMPLLGGSPIYLHPGADTSVFAATSDAGVVETYEYSAYGETSFYNGTGQSVANSTFGNRFLFQGQFYDAAVGGYSMRAREYLARAGRFLSPDPIGIAGGENVYAFVLDKPLSLRDPMGLSGINFSIATADLWVVFGAGPTLNGSALQSHNDPFAEFQHRIPRANANSFLFELFAPPSVQDFYSRSPQIADLGGRQGIDALAALSTRQALRAQTAMNHYGFWVRQAGQGVGFTASALGTVGSVGSMVGRMGEAPATVGVGARGAAQTLSSSEIAFSQSSVRGVEEIAASMRANGWVGPPIDVVSIEGRLITVDNTRVLAAHLTGTPVEAVVHAADEVLPASMAGRFVSAAGVEATTWGEAVLIRIGNQSAGYQSVYPLGSWVTGVKP